MKVTIQIDGQAVSVEVTVEVYEYLDRADHKEENLAHEQRRHWDGRELDEYIILAEGHACYDMTPEQYVCHKETMQEIHAALMLCTESQRRRFLLYALEDMSLAEIGRVCGCSRASVFESIQAVRRKIKNFLAGHPDNSPFFGLTSEGRYQSPDRR